MRHEEIRLVACSCLHKRRFVIAEGDPDFGDDMSGAGDGCVEPATGPDDGFMGCCPCRRACTETEAEAYVHAGIALHLTTPATENGEKLDPNARILQRRKANYASRSDELRLRWRRGVVGPEQPESPGSTVFGNVDVLDHRALTLRRTKFTQFFPDEDIIEVAAK